MPPGGLSKLHPLDSRHRQPIRIVLLYVCWRVGAPSEEKLICDNFNLEAHTVNQVKFQSSSAPFGQYFDPTLWPLPSLFTFRR